MKKLIQFPRPLVSAIQREIGEDDRGFSQFVRNACWKALESRTQVGREITISPSGTSTVDSYMEWILARRPCATDFMGSGGEMDHRIRRVLRAKLTESQAERVELRFQGMSLEDIGRRHGCTRQAVFNTLQRAEEVLKTDEDFIQCLLVVLDPEGELGLTPEMLMEAAK
jgi:DNA-binding CsgD family transcriptional regulator